MYKEDKLKAFIDSGEASAWAAGRRFSEENRSKVAGEAKKPAQPPPKPSVDNRPVARAALMKLGVPARAADEMLSNVRPDLPVEDMIRMCLK